MVEVEEAAVDVTGEEVVTDHLAAVVDPQHTTQLLHLVTKCTESDNTEQDSLKLQITTLVSVSDYLMIL